MGVGILLAGSSFMLTALGQSGRGASATALGHAMKAADHDRARGAVIGKAMTGLKRATGLVLVLVQPQ